MIENPQPSPQRHGDGALSVNIDIRLKSNNLVIPWSRICIAIGTAFTALATYLGWLLAR